MQTQSRRMSQAIDKNKLQSLRRHKEVCLLQLGHPGADETDDCTVKSL